MTELSIVIPVLNEEKNLETLHKSIITSLKKENISYEIIFIDDGSTDNSYNLLAKLHQKDKRVKVIKFAGNFGQTSAWDAGIKAAKGQYIITMDSDLQNDPSDIPRMLNAIKNSNYDAISGWRTNRKDSFSKKFFSIFANFLRKAMTKEKIHDSGCSLKIYKKECFDNVDLYGEMHRYITAVLALEGLRIGEIKVRHNPRKHGKTKYGAARLLKGSLDLLFMAFMTKYSTRPLHLFGSLGIATFLLGMAISLYLTILKFSYGESLSERPMLILSVLLLILGIQFIFFGILAEIMMRIYYKMHNRKPYIIKKVLK
ncbi:glycosyltransferase family 2 protein [Candidatus Woesearchaeota archaeon]|nr:glycosyltransferase family 2 protein [Candidatus Woesearchaeota archaeon]